MNDSIDRMPSEPDRTLPEPPTAEQVTRMENAVIGRVHGESARRRIRRVRIWSGTAAAVAVVALAALISPAVTSSISGADGAVSAVDQSAVAPAAEPFRQGDAQSVEDAAESLDAAGAESVTGDLDTAGRDVITSGWMQVTVDDVRDATSQVTALAEAEGGYVESVSIGNSGVQPYDDTSTPVPGDSWISVRVPADRLDAVVAEVGGFGEVTSSSIDRSDVTDQAVDLRARIAAQEASVARLTELMAQAGSVGDLITAESALSDRQAALDADRQQLELLEGQVALSSLTVSLTRAVEPTQADPAGFADGLAAGWNGLVATLNGTVVALGFLLPWLVVVGVAAAVGWGVRRLVLRRRARRAARPVVADVDD
ncbi:DUF4349 domain-containing protein [Microbacterium sp. 18062]|uniref:DUF4349 domain-containing protein n=1 Tax=Microbacterium sp. 18062 TaxID=2681410 RepID=UPI001F187E7F|nr:DUF4349 domain-containing protein [Microbacterium sp. 18062]